MLTPKQIRFVNAVAEDDGRSYHKCAIDSGYADSSAAESASINMKNPQVLAAIDKRKAELAAAAGVSVGLVLREWLTVATADASELVTIEEVRCAHCWEMDDLDLPVNPACASCKGQGVKFVSVKPTKSLSPAARRLFAGAKQTKDGIDVKLRDQDAAWSRIADYLGMLNKSKGELSGPGGGPIPLLHATPADLSDAQLEALAAGGAVNLGVAEGVSTPMLPANCTIEAACEPLGLPE